MDTRAPPIASRSQERCQHPHKQQPLEEVTLPPLTPFPPQRQRTKFTGSSQSGWRSASAAPPEILRQQEIQRRRPYKVLAIGATPLMHACQQADRARVLKLLREQEETIGYRDRALRSALHYCMDAGTGGALAQAAPELVNAPDAEGHTPLHLAVIAGDTQLVAVLLANGADVNANDLEGHSVLHWATVCGELQCVELVLAAGAEPSSADLRGGSALHYAAQCCGAPATAELAVPKKVGLQVLEKLLEFGADVNATDEDGRQPILWAASAGSVDAILALVRTGGSSVAGASDKDGLTALHCAASRGHARCIEVLVNLCNAQPDHVDDNGCSPLHYAATLGHADATSLLLKLGADPNRQDRKGRTPALCAAAKGQLETVRILSNQGASLHARTLRGTGMAHEAVASGRLELIRWLAKRRPGLLNVATPEGKTPLHVAALHGHLDACKLLLDNGARVEALLRSPKNQLMTALDAALYRGHRDCAKLIQLHGGLTAQHLGSHRPPQSRVIAPKMRVKPVNTSTESELNHEDGSEDVSGDRRGRQPPLYYEERWVERRTRRRANRRRLSRHDSRSFSEEELHCSKASATTPAQRRALSENARYEASDVDAQGSRRKSQRHTKRKEDETAEPTSGCESEGSSTKSDEESSSVSDDSLEVVVVRRSLQRTSEKIVTGKKSMLREMSKETSKETKDSSRSSKSDSKRSSRKDQDNLKEEKSEFIKRKTSAHEQKTFDKDGDSTSQDTVEQVTITADVHKNEAPDSSRDKISDADREAAIEQEPEGQVRSKMDEILEKADELQNALLTKAADLKKDMEEMRQQMSQKSENDEMNGEDENKEDKSPKIISDEDKISKTPSSPTNDGTASAKEDSPRYDTEMEGRKTSVTDQQSAAETSEKEMSARKNDEFKEETEEEQEKADTEASEKDMKKEFRKESSAENVRKGSSEDTRKRSAEEIRKNSIEEEALETKRDSIVKETTPPTTMNEIETKEDSPPSRVGEKKTTEAQRQSADTHLEVSIPGAEGFRYADESSSSSPAGGKAGRRSKSSTGKRRARVKPTLFESSEERSPDRSAIIAVIESPEWDEDDEEIDKEIRQVVGDTEEHDEDEDEEDEDDESDGLGIVRVLPSTSEDDLGARTSTIDSLPQLRPKMRAGRPTSPRQHDSSIVRTRQRRDSGGRDSGIEPSPRISRIPRRQIKCCPNSERQQTLNMDTVTRDVQISLRRYHLERKIFFQLMELKRLQIRQGRANEQVLIKRQVEQFHKAGMSGPALGVARYDRPFTFRHFETFLYEQLRRLQRRPATPDWCTEAKQCTQKTHRCHHATSAYTSVPIYTYHYNCSRWRRPRTTEYSSEDRRTRQGTDDGGTDTRPRETSDCPPIREA